MGNLRQVPSLTMYPPIPCAYHRTCCIVGAQQIISRRMYIRMGLTHHVILGKSLLPSGSNQSILKEINPEYSLEGVMLKLKVQYFGHLMRRADSFDPLQYF